MTAPTIVPTGYQGDYRDYLNVKADKSGAARLSSGSVSVPAATATDTVIGLVPFQAGARFVIGGYSIHCADLDTSTNVTLDVGVAYENTTAGTDALTTYVAASTVPQAGGFVTPTAVGGLTYVTTGNGWLVAQVNAATTTTGSITWNIPLVYDQPID